jgi:hypothetical protein
VSSGALSQRANGGVLAVKVDYYLVLLGAVALAGVSSPRGRSPAPPRVTRAHSSTPKSKCPSAEDAAVVRNLELLQNLELLRYLELFLSAEQAPGDAQKQTAKQNP